MEDKERVDAGQGRKGSPGKEFGKEFGKCILFASKASESLRNSESEGLGSTDDARRSGSPEDSKPARSNDRNHVDSMGKKDFPGKKSEKRTLFVSQTEETSESLRYPVLNICVT
jgi:hypothetical protein